MTALAAQESFARTAASVAAPTALGRGPGAYLAGRHGGPYDYALPYPREGLAGSALVVRVTGRVCGPCLTTAFIM